MLSFFRKKSLEDSNQSADQTVPSPSSSRTNSICDNMQFKDSDALVRELGYSNLTELKETVYGKRKRFMHSFRFIWNLCQICCEPSEILKSHRHWKT